MLFYYYILFKTIVLFRFITFFFFQDEVILNPVDESQIISDVNRILNSYNDCKFTARAIARIFHGIESPNFPAYVWGRSPFWRIHLKSDFNAICKIAQKQIIYKLK